MNSHGGHAAAAAWVCTPEGLVVLVSIFVFSQQLIIAGISLRQQTERREEMHFIDYKLSCYFKAPNRFASP